jgi:hypothetical protein
MGPVDKRVFVIVALVALVIFAVIASAAALIPAVYGWLFRPPDNLVTLLGAVLVAIGLGATALQWRSDNESKREEARSRRHAEYAERLGAYRTWETNAAIMMLLNFDRDVIIRAGQPAERVSWADCELALIPASYRKYLYEPKLIAIRDCFNGWIENMSRLVYLENERLVERKDVDHLCKTLLQRVANEPQFAKTPFSRNLRLYIQWRGAEQVLVLFQRYGCDIKPLRDEDKAALSADIESGKYGQCEPSMRGSI